MSRSAGEVDDVDVEDLECVGADPAGMACRGAVEMRWPLSGSGRSFPRCDGHWDERLRLEEEIRARYPVRPPHD